MWAQKLCRVLPGMRKEKMSINNRAFPAGARQQNPEPSPTETRRLKEHREFMYRMAKAHRHVMEALADGEADTAKFLTIAILTSWEDFVWNDFNDNL